MVQEEDNQDGAVVISWQIILCNQGGASWSNLPEEAHRLQHVSQKHYIITSTCQSVPELIYSGGRISSQNRMESVYIMLQDHWVTAADLDLSTNASGTHGFGAYFQGTRIMGTWSTAQLPRSNQWKELFAIVAAAATWGNQWQRRKRSWFSVAIKQ